ncbi:MAG: hypothetical protein ACT4OO_08220 [Nitrospiraceae bacterium]
MVRVRPSLIVLYCLAAVIAACHSLPSLEEQKQKIANNDLLLHQLTPRAFAETWGSPTYAHVEFTPFLTAEDGTLVPLSRIQLKQSPQEWADGVDAGDALFLAYADRGDLLVFLEDRLVYREALTPEQIHRLGKTWKHEAQFRSTLGHTSMPTY